jgi:energy-coupling factor transport system ATP-binding protein
MLLSVSGLSYSPHQDASSEFILRDINFQIEAGDFWVILGGRGAGKTTLLQLLAGLLSPSTGEVFFPAKGEQGKDMLRKEIGLVFQYPEHQFFQSTVADDIGYVLKQRGLKAVEIEACAREALSGVGLEYEELRQRSPFELSGGEQRRLAIACVLINKPQVLVLDEPVTGLDARAKNKVLDCLKQLNSKEGIAILLATSCLGEVAHLARKLLILNSGKQAYCGEASEVFNRPQILSREGLGLPPLLELGLRLKELGYPVEYPQGNIAEVVVQLKRFKVVV